MSFRSLALLRVAAFFAVSLLLTACEGDRPELLSGVETIEVPAADPGAQTNQNIANPTLVIPDTFPVSEGDELTLVWSEEFDGPNIDPEVWFFATGDGTEKGLPGGWGNNELQYYLPDNAMIVNGVLELTARRETVGNLNYTSARINTEDRFAFKYGRIEASIKLPSGQGLWPAFWMLSQDSDYLCGGEPCIWAAIGEIDIMEAVNLGGTGGNEILGTLHYGGEAPGNVFTGEIYTPSVDVTEDFHTYALEWDADEIRWYFDGLLYAAQNSWYSTADNGGPGAPFNQPFHILLNLAVGGNLPGSPNGATPFPATMEVDWVRVYSGEDPDGGVATEPNVSAPTPTEDPAGVISLFSDAYTNISGIDYNPNWNQATVVTIAQIAGNKMLKYAGLNYQGMDFAGNPQDVSDKGFLHLDFWTADSTALNVYLISPGPVETSYELTGDIAPNSWVSVDIPLSEFAGVDLTNLIQLKFDGNGTIFLDNLYFAGEAPIIVPPVGVAPPQQNEADVISLFSSDYTNETVSWPTSWSAADAGIVTDLTIDGTLVKEHIGINYVGVEFVVDASSMTHLHVDVWTPDVDSLLLRLVDFLGDGFANDAGDTQGELTFDLSSSQGEWVSLDIPLSDFQDAGLTSVSDLNQLIVDPTPDGTTLYVANLYFYNADTSGGGDGLAGDVDGDGYVYLYATDTGTTVDLVADTDFTIFNWDSGSVITTDFATDPDYNPVIQVVEGTGWGAPNAAIAFTGLTAGFADNYSFLHFKIKDLPTGSVFVKFASGGGAELEVEFDLATYATDIPGTTGWKQVTIPLSSFPDLAAYTEFAILGGWSNGGTFLLTDVAFTGPLDGGGGELAVNGDFETGDISGWTDFSGANNGTFTATTAEANGGSYSGNLVASVPAGGGPASFPVVKQANIGIGTVQPNSTVTVSFDLKGSIVGTGGVIFVEFFSELSSGGTSQAGIISQPVPTSSWVNYSIPVTTGNDVSGGVTLQLKADCGANAGCTVDAYFDNVSVVAD